MSRFQVDVLIPAYKEKGYIEKTLKYLTKQTLYKSGLVHIVVGEYLDELHKFNQYTKNICATIPNADYITIDRKGIAYARNQMVEKAAFSDVFMSFDSDAIFNRLDAIEIMITPIIEKEKVMTNCESIFFDFVNHKEVKEPVLPDYFKVMSDISTNLEKVVLARGPGLTLSREAFDKVGGFRDVSVGEDWWMGFDIVKEYGILQKKFIDSVKVLMSDRRAKAFSQHGMNVFDYTNMSFR